MARMLTKAGRYQIVSELGRGSMGVVYQGFDPVIGRTVAIKTMLIEGLSSSEFQEFKARFQREAQAAGILAHPNIVTVYDFGEDEGVLYLAMEYLEGKSLQSIVENQHVLPLETIVPMFEQVCSALDHAHSHKIVHRDIKPANIMILDSGLVKVTDFGIAKMMSMGMTQAGQVLGTPNYMSPEQVKGRPVDGRSDIFSLGVILYELVTGEKPFGGQNITTVIYKIINENPIPPRELDATIHPGLSYVIQKSLAKSPEERYQTCRELADDLKNYKNLGGATAPSETVVIKVPPIQSAVPPELRTPPAAGPVAAAPPPAQRVARPAPPPVAAAQAPAPKSSAVIWVVLAILLIGALGGGGYYFLYIRPQPNTATTRPGPTPGTKPPVTPYTGTAGPTATAPSPTPYTGTGAPAPTQVPTATGGNTTPGTTTPPTTETPGNAAATTPGTTAKKTAPPPAPVVKKPPAPAPQKPAAPATLAIKSDPGGAQIVIDGQSDPAWITPKIFDQEDPGPHEIILSKLGYKTTRQHVRLKGGTTKVVSMTLPLLPPRPKPKKHPAPAPATSTKVKPPSPYTGVATPAVTPETQPVTVVLKIETVPPGIQIVVDGKAWGPSPVQKPVPPGPHSVTLKENGVDVYSTTVKVKSGVLVDSRKFRLNGS